MRFLKKTLKVFLFLAIIVLVLMLLLLKPVNRSPLEENAYFKTTLNNLKALQLQHTEGKQWYAGWDAQNVTPAEPVDLVGFRPRGNYDFVLDSSFVKSMVISNGKANVAFLSYQLMIIHPALSQSIREAVQEANLPIDHLYFTASHTHSGYGGHMKGLLSKVMYGGYDTSIVKLLVKKSLIALKNSIHKSDSVEIKYFKADAESLVRNRFISKDPVDPFVRQLHLEKKDGSRALLFSFSAHATTLSSDFMGLSGDYPHFLEQELQNNQDYELAIFAAGTVGSHSPIIPAKSEQTTIDYAKDLAERIFEHSDTIIAQNSATLSFGSLNIALEEPHLRVSDNYRLKPALFEFLIGHSRASMDILRLGDLLFLSSSAEVSGVFYHQWEELANQYGLELMLTTFNGNYIGYAPPDQYYHKHYRESRELNWYGPHTGSYYDTLVKSAILKVGN